MSRRGNTDILIDVTSLIGAEEFLISQNRRTEPEDPFARQCFAELVQSLIFMSRVFVAHPVLLNANPSDFGERPHLLRSLMAADLLAPLPLDITMLDELERSQGALIADLESVRGIQSTARFVEQALGIDRATKGRQVPLAARIKEWSSFQSRKVRFAPGHHHDRIPTPEGVEDDEFGQWARAAAVVLGSVLSEFTEPPESVYFMATLARGLKYQARANVGGVSYQSHPLRRDFSLTFDLTRAGGGDDAILDVLQVVRGIHESLAQAADPEDAFRLRLVQFELPLLGGRLWTADEAGRLADDAWVDSIVARICDYRERAADLRLAVERCATEEDQIRLARDIEVVKRHLLERLGLRSVEMSQVEREMVDSVASVAQVIPGVPKVSGLWMGARTIGKQRNFSNAAPHQRFLYREFLDAWKRTSK